jgi:phosphonate transport system substrate-binding protein
VIADRPLMLGATAADPKRSVFIWNAIRTYFKHEGLDVDYALYSTYDALCRHLLDGQIDIAWNAPMAHAQSIARTNGACRTLAMRDTDQDVQTVIVARADSGIESLEDLRGRRLALGLEISSELWLLPVAQLEQQGLDVRNDLELVEFEAVGYPNLQSWVDDAMIFDAVVEGRADAGAIFDPWLAPLMRRHGLTENDLVEVWRTRPYSHCAFTSRPGLDDATCERFVELLLAMDPSDPDIAEMMRMEHLGEWVRATNDGWEDLITAIDAADLVGKIF